MQRIWEQPKLEISTLDKNRCGRASTTQTRTNNYCNKWLSFLEALVYNEGRHTWDEKDNRERPRKFRGIRECQFPAYIPASGLVGGPALVEEWEREWKIKFGEEQDEVESEGEDGDDEDSEDKEGKEESPDRATKKPLSPVAVPNDQVPEKRKRGRLRNLLPSTVSESHHRQTRITQQAGQNDAAFFHHQPATTILFGCLRSFYFLQL